MGNRFIKPMQREDWRFRLTNPKEYEKMVEQIEIMHKFTRQVIEERREALETAKAQGTNKTCKLYKTFYHRFINSKKQV